MTFYQEVSADQGDFRSNARPGEWPSADEVAHHIEGSTAAYPMKGGRSALDAELLQQVTNVAVSHIAEWCGFYVRTVDITETDPAGGDNPEGRCWAVVRDPNRSPDDIPVQLHHAAMMFAARLYHRQQSPSGVTGARTELGVVLEATAIDTDIMAMISNYRILGLH